MTRFNPVIRSVIRQPKTREGARAQTRNLGSETILQSPASRTFQNSIGVFALGRHASPLSSLHQTVNRTMTRCLLEDYSNQ